MPGIHGKVKEVSVRQVGNDPTLSVTSGAKKISIKYSKNEQSFDSAVALATVALTTGLRFHFHQGAGGKLTACKLQK